jgi:hypothetical protein
LRSKRGQQRLGLRILSDINEAASGGVLLGIEKS